MSKLDQLTYVAQSKIHGKGLFARKNIKKNTVLGYLEGKPTRRDGDYVLWITETEGFQVTCDLRYINHADKPNAVYYDDLSVVILRNISADEEITHNYESADW